MSLDIDLLELRPVAVTVYSLNFTHNLNVMAKAVGLYEAIWRPENLRITIAGDLIQILENGLAKLQAGPDEFRQYEPANKWGTYETFVSVVSGYLEACKDHPEATISVSSGGV